MDRTKGGTRRIYLRKLLLEMTKQNLKPLLKTNISHIQNNYLNRELIYRLLCTFLFRAVRSLSLI